MLGVWGRYGAEGTLGTTRGRARYMSGVRSEVRWVHLKGTLGTLQGYAGYASRFP